MESTRSANYGEVSVKTDDFWLGDCRRLHGDSGISPEIHSIDNCSFLKITFVVLPTQYLFSLLVKALDFSKGTIICPLSVRVPGLKHQITDKWHFYLTGATENCKTPCYDFCWDYWEEKIAVFHVYHWEGCQKLCLHKEKP